MLWAAAMVVVFDVSCRLFLPQGSLADRFDLVRARVMQEAAPDIQVVGDSVARSGFIPSALSNGVVTVRNDAVVGSGPPFTYLLLREQIESGRKPKAIVIAHSPHTFADIRFPVLVGAFAHWSEMPHLFVEADDWTQVLYGTFTRMSYVLMHRDSFRQLFTNGNADFFLERSRPEDLEMPPDSRRLTGFLQRIAARDMPEDRLADDPPGRYRVPFRVSAENDRFFRKMLQLARTHGIEVFWLTMPVPQSVQQARAAVNYERDMLAYLQPFVSRGELRILKGEFTVYEDWMFRDHSHLNEAGAVRLACAMRALSEPVLAASTKPSMQEASNTVGVELPPERRGAPEILERTCEAFGSGRTPSGSLVAEEVAYESP